MPTNCTKFVIGYSTPDAIRLENELKAAGVSEKCFSLYGNYTIFDTTNTPFTVTFDGTDVEEKPLDGNEYKEKCGQGVYRLYFTLSNLHNPAEIAWSRWKKYNPRDSECHTWIVAEGFKQFFFFGRAKLQSYHPNSSALSNKDSKKSNPLCFYKAKLVEKTKTANVDFIILNRAFSAKAKFK